MTYADEVLADSPYLYWRLGDLSGSFATDSSGNGRDGSYLNGVTLGAPSLLASDPGNAAVSLDGTDDYVSYNDSADLTDFSVECWIKTTSNTDGFLIHRWSVTSINRIFVLIYQSTGRMYFEVVNNASVGNITSQPSGNLGDDNPHHIVATFSSGTLQLYVDGVAVGTPSSLSGTLRTINTPFRVGGGDSGGVLFDGVVDEVAYYTTALSPERILAHYDAAFAPDPPVIDTTSLPAGEVDVFYSETLEVTGEPGVWSITDGDLPDGLTLDPDTGVISGTPTVAGSFCFEVTYTDENDLSDTVPLCISIVYAPTPPRSPTRACGCASDWRLELLDLATGVRRSWLPFLAFQFDDLLNEVGSAQITIPVRKVGMADVWPHLRAVAITRVAGPGASKTNPVCEYIGMIESATANSQGTVELGLQSIDHYLSWRVITGDTTYTSTDQNDIGANLVNLATGSGVPLNGTSETSAYTRTRTYLADDDNVILDRIGDLTKSINGPDYQRIYAYFDGAWGTEMRFSDYVGNTTARSLNAIRGLSSYGVSVDASNHANWVRGRDQSGDVYADDTYMTDIYPRFDKAIQWSDVTLNDTLEEHVDGYLAANGDPLAVPDVTVANLDIAASYGLGDTIALNMNMGAARYAGDARLVGKSWSISEGQPTGCTFTLVPLDNAQTAILNAPIIASPRGCC